MKKSTFWAGVIAIFLAFSFIVGTVYAGRLYIKPNLERNRAERLLDEAEMEFRNGKLHITLSPEISVEEFRIAKEKIAQAIEIIEKYGEGYFTPGDVDDFTERMRECDLWIRRSQQAIRDQSR